MKEEFRHYLETKGYSHKTAVVYSNYLTEYTTWTKENQLQQSQVTYSELMDFIGYLQQEKQYSPRNVNERLRVVSIYNQKQQYDNQAARVRLKGEVKNTTIKLTEEELNQVYNSYREPTKRGYFRYTNQIILGLIIYQALTRKEIYNLQLTDLNLTKGTIRVAASRKTKAERTIQLQAHQILPLHEYLLTKRGINHPLQTGDPEESTKLLSPNCDKPERLNDQIKVLNQVLQQQLKDTEIPFTTLRQLQQSRITEWVRLYGIRKAQYLAGFKTIAQAEKYRSEDTKDLAEQINLHHPLK